MCIGWISRSKKYNTTGFAPDKEKNCAVGHSSCVYDDSDGTGNLAGTQATGAGIDSFWGTVHHRLDALNIGFPSAIGTTVGMGNLNAERHTFTANIAFCQFLHLLVSHRTVNPGTALKSNRNILAENPFKSKFFFQVMKKS